jgi:hypothetical protein
MIVKQIEENLVPVLPGFYVSFRGTGTVIPRWTAAGALEAENSFSRGRCLSRYAETDRGAARS